MKYAIIIAEPAERDIMEAADYIEYTLLNPQAADGLLDAVETSLAALAEHPHRIRPVSDPVLSAWGIRFIRIGNYLAFFTVDDEARRVTVVRFLYTRRDWISLLREGMS